MYLHVHCHYCKSCRTPKPAACEGEQQRRARHTMPATPAFAAAAPAARRPPPRLSRRPPRCALPPPPTPLDVDIASFSLPSPVAAPATPVRAGDEPPAHAIAASSFAISSRLPPRARAALRAALTPPPAPPPRPSERLRAALAAGGPGAAAGAALLVDFAPSDAVMRVAWAGACGFVVLRSNDVVFRTHCVGTACARMPLERALGGGGDGDGGGGGDGGRETKSEGSGPVRGSRLAEVHAAEVALADGDLILAGSHAVFANLSERQMVAFVRPVDSMEDAQLAIANATCLGTWRTDDPEFISYMLVHLAHTFATSPTAAQLPPQDFPPGTHGVPFCEGDLTVIAASCSFAL